MGTGAGGARILLDGRRASPAGAAFAGASTIDAFDAHDGHPLTKGHAGVAVLPALLAVADAEGGGDGRDLLAALVLGYEVAIRAGIALHAERAGLPHLGRLERARLRRGRRPAARPLGGQPPAMPSASPNITGRAAR